MTRLWLLTALCFVSCSSLGNLERPALVRSTSNGLCGSTLALEPDNDVWGEGGCENGGTLLKPQGLASPRDADELRRQFDALKDVVCVEEPTNERGEQMITFTRLGKGEPDVVFRRCKTDGPEPWTALDRAFDAL